MQRVYHIVFVCSVVLFLLSLAGGVYQSLRTRHHLPDILIGFENQIQALIESNEFDRALDQLELAQRIEFDQRHIHLNRIGNIYSERGQFDLAKKRYFEALGTRPNYTEAHHNLAVALQSQNKLDGRPERLAEAIDHYQTVIQLDPEHAQAHYNLAVALQAQGKLAEAIIRYERSVQLQPEHAEAHNNLGRALQVDGKLEDAIRHYRQAIRIRPDYGGAHYNLGVALRIKGQINEAIEHYQKAVQLMPNYAHAHTNLGILLNTEGKVQEAIQHFRRVVELQPQFNSAHTNLGHALRDNGQLDEALEQYLKALEIAPNSPALLDLAARILTTHLEPDRRDPTQAVALAERAVELTNRQHPQLLETLAMAQAAAGQFEIAVTTAETALQLAETAKAETLVSRLREKLDAYRRQGSSER